MKQTLKSAAYIVLAAIVGIAITPILLITAVYELIELTVENLFSDKPASELHTPITINTPNECTDLPKEDSCL